MNDLETPRLRLRPCRIEDVDALHAIWTDPAVRRYLWDDVVIPRTLAEQVVAASVADWMTQGYGQWIVYRDGTDAAGFAGLRLSAWCDAPELLFGLLPAHWGQGLATEAARAVIDDGFDRLGLNAIVAATDTPNVASARVLDRVGMSFERRGVLNGLDTVFYAMRRELRASRSAARKLNPLPPCGGGG